MVNKPKLNEPDVEITTTFTGESITINMTIPTKQFKDIFVTGTSVNSQQPNPAFFECVKEWNQKGWLVDIHKREITISDNRSLAQISIDRKDKTYWCSHYLSFELHYLLTKTLKALEGLKDE